MFDIAKSCGSALHTPLYSHLTAVCALLAAIRDPSDRSICRLQPSSITQQPSSIADLASRRDHDAAHPEVLAGGSKSNPLTRAPALPAPSPRLDSGFSAADSVPVSPATDGARPFSQAVAASKAAAAASVQQRPGQQVADRQHAQRLLQLLEKVESYKSGSGGDGSRLTAAARRWAAVRAHFLKSRFGKPASFVGLLLQKKAARDRFEQSMNAFGSKKPL